MSGWLRFPPLWETSGLSLVAVGLHLVVCDEWCMMCVVLCPIVLCCVVLSCVKVYGVLWCVMWCCGVCSFLLFAQAVCYSKREPNIEEYWEQQQKT